MKDLRQAVETTDQTIKDWEETELTGMALMAQKEHDRRVQEEKDYARILNVINNFERRIMDKPEKRIWQTRTPTAAREVSKEELSNEIKSVLQTDCVAALLNIDYSDTTPDFPRASEYISKAIIDLVNGGEK